MVMQRVPCVNGSGPPQFHQVGLALSGFREGRLLKFGTKRNEEKVEVFRVPTR